MSVMLRKLVDLVRLGRPIFLVGGLILYALGAMIARAQGIPIDWRMYWTGQLALSSIQLMTHYLNDYWDAETDAGNRNRTPFSGGSGIIPEGRISRQTALYAGLLFTAVGITLFLVLVIGRGAGAIFASLFSLIFLGAYFYSTPPVKLAESGYGEFTTSMIVAGLLPMAAYTLQAHRLDPLVLLATIPLVTLHFAMLLAFELPDRESDEASGKRTFLVRVGKAQGIRIHNTLVVLAFVLLAISPLLGMPWRVALGTIIALPLAVTQIVLMVRLSRGRIILWSWLTFGAIALFALTAYLMAFGFWVIG